MSFEALPFSLRQLQYAVAVADGLSFRRAAERCHVSQPALSAQIALLEGALGLPLFERDRQRVLVTAAGEALLARARALLRDADDLVALARRAGDPLSGTLQIGVIPTISPYLLPQLARPLAKAFPKLTIMWTEDKTERLIKRLSEGSLDGALLALEANLGDVEHELVGHDPFVLATPVGHPLATTQKPITMAALAGADFLLLDDGHCLREQALTFCQAARTRELAFRATSLATLVQMVASGAGITLLPEIALATETARARLSVRRVAPPAPGRTLVFCWRKRAPLGPFLRRLAVTMRGAYPASGALPRTTGRTRRARKAS